MGPLRDRRRLGGRPGATEGRIPGRPQILERGRIAQSFEAFAHFSETVRSLRDERRAAITQAQAPAYAPLIAADRAARVLPLADALALSDRATESLDRFHRHSLLLWHGTRLLKDFSPGQAIRLFENARLFFETEPLRIANEKAAAMNLAKLTVTTKSPEGGRVGMG